VQDVCFSSPGKHRGEGWLAVWDWIESLSELMATLVAGIPSLGGWSYVLLAVLVATEGPLSTLVGASASAAGLLDLRLVFVATVVGNIVGDCLWYSLGYMGKMNWLFEHGRWLGIRPRHVERLEREMQAHATKLIVFAKIAYGLIVPTLVAAGMARVPWRKWFPTVFIVETLWSILLVWVGYHATAFIQDFEQGLHAVGVALLVGGAAFVLFRMLRKRIDRTELELDPLNQVILAETSVSVAPVAEDLPHYAEVTPREYEGQADEQRCVALPERERTR
jgi:membrane protein DedA with SNARE-associated domain